MYTSFQAAYLAINGRTTIYRQYFQSVNVFGIVVQISCYLETKLAGRAEDKRLWNSVFYVNLLEQGQTECGCFTCSCLCKSYYIIIFS